MLCARTCYQHSLMSCRLRLQACALRLRRGPGYELARARSDVDPRQAGADRAASVPEESSQALSRRSTASTASVRAAGAAGTRHILPEYGRALARFETLL